MTQPLRFGAYPFSTIGGPTGPMSGPPDELPRIGTALHELAGSGPALLVRVHVLFTGSVGDALSQVAQLAELGNLVDLSLDYHDPGGDVEGWCSFVQEVVHRYGASVGSIGITNEADLISVPYAPDGAYPHALEALIQGLLAAADAKRRAKSTALLGFTASSAGKADADAFWDALARRGGRAFAAAAEFVGLTIYPGGFSGPPPSAIELRRITTNLLLAQRARLTAAGIPGTVPIRIAECGWPTGPGRTETGQCEVLATVLDTVIDLQPQLGISHWQLFVLRDADSQSPDPFGHFGLLRDDYSAKPAFDMLRVSHRVDSAIGQCPMTRSIESTTAWPWLVVDHGLVRRAGMAPDGVGRSSWSLPIAKATFEALIR